MTTVLFSAAAPSDDLRHALAAAGFAVADHALGSTPPVEFDAIAVAVVDVGDRPDAAAAQTRRWRIELGDHLVPVLWVCPVESAAAGLAAGADTVLSRPLDDRVFVAQVQAMARVHAAAVRVAVKAGEARLLGDQLRKTYSQLDRELDLARRVQRSFQPHALPEVGGVRFAVCHRQRSRAGGDFHDVRRLDEDHVGFVVGDVMGSGAATGSLLGLLVSQAVRLKDVTGTGYRLIPPDEALAAANRELLGLGFEEPPLVAALAGTVNVRTGAVTLARAGLPAPVYLPPIGNAEAWSVPGPFLGTADTTFQPLSGTLEPGGKLVIGTDGTRPDGDPGPVGTARLIEAAERHRERSGAAFAEALAGELLPGGRHADDFTLLVASRAEKGTGYFSAAEK